MFVDGDRDRLGQCITNLLSNAVKFSQTGSPIVVRLTRVEDRAVVEVQDAGRGIPAAMLPRIFDLFVQADCSLDRRSGGLGIGLSVCKRLTEMHGGTLQAFSEGEGRGATFRLSLPLVEPVPAPAPSATEAAPVAVALRILVVDDNRDAADSIALLLGLSGHECGVAYDGPQALDVWSRFRPDVVLLDIGLPGLDRRLPGDSQPARARVHRTRHRRERLRSARRSREGKGRGVRRAPGEAGGSRDSGTRHR
jgi:hypothetical protein